LGIYRRLERGRQQLTDHPLYQILAYEPNGEMTAMTLRETMQQHLLTWGNSFAEIIRDRAGRPLELWLKRPDCVAVRRTDAGAIVYDIKEDPKSKQITATISSENMLHIPGLSFDGLVGYTPIRMAKETIGLAKASEKYGASLFGNSAKPSIILKHPQTMDEEAHKTFKASWDSAYGGAEKGNSTVILEEGMGVEKLSFAPEEAQFLESRRFSVEEICRWFNVPPSMVQDHERSTFSNVEQQFLNFVIVTLTPWLVRWEQEIHRKLLLPREKRQLYAKHSVDALLRGDSSSRAAFLQSMVVNGIYTPNEARAYEELNPEEAGDVLYMQGAMVPLTALAATDQTDPEQVEDRAGMIGRLAELHRPWLADAFRKVLKSEAEIIGRAQKRERPFDVWYNGFCADTHDVVRGAIIPSVEAFVGSAYVALTGNMLTEQQAHDLAESTIKIVKRHIGQSQVDVSSGADLAAWSNGRADQEATVAMADLMALVQDWTDG